MAVVTPVKYTLLMVNILSQAFSLYDKNTELTSNTNITGRDSSSLTQESTNAFQYTFNSLPTTSILLSSFTNSDTSSAIEITTVTNFLSVSNSFGKETNSITTIDPSHTVGYETTYITRSEASHTTAIEPTHTVGYETNNVSTIDPSHTVGYETTYITRSEASHTTAIEPTHTVGYETNNVSTIDPSHTVGYETTYITHSEASRTTAIEPTHTVGYETTYMTHSEASHTTAVEPTHTVGYETNYITTIDPSHTVSYETNYITHSEANHTIAIEPTNTVDYETNYKTTIDPSHTVGYETTYITRIEATHTTSINASTTNIEQNTTSNATSIMVDTSFYYSSESFVNTLYQFKSYSTITLGSSQLDKSRVIVTDVYGTTSIASSVSVPEMHTETFQSSSGIFDSTKFSISSSINFQERSTTTPFPPSVFCIFECRVNVTITTNMTFPQLHNRINETFSNELKSLYSDYQSLAFSMFSTPNNNTIIYWFNLYFNKAYCENDVKQAIITKYQKAPNDETANFTIQLNTLQIKPFSILESRALSIDLEIKLNTTFKNELKDESSIEYKTLKYLVIEALSSSLQDMPGFVEVTISGFEEGSIVVKSQLVFDKEKISPNEDIKPIIQVYIIRYFGQKNDQIGVYKVNINSLKINEAQVPASSSSNFPAWLIVLIIAIIIIVPLVLVLILLTWHIKKKNRTLQISSVEDRSTKRSTIELQNLQLTNDVIENAHKNNNKESSEGKINHLFYGDLSEEVNDENLENQEFKIPYQNK